MLSDWMLVTATQGVLPFMPRQLAKPVPAQNTEKTSIKSTT
jgi:hypothetical protein